MPGVASLLGGERRTERDNSIIEHVAAEVLEVLDSILEVRVAQRLDGTPGEDVLEMLGVVGVERDFSLAERRTDIGIQIVAELKVVGNPDEPEFDVVGVSAGEFIEDIIVFANGVDLVKDDDDRAADVFDFVHHHLEQLFPLVAAGLVDALAFPDFAEFFDEAGECVVGVVDAFAGDVDNLEGNAFLVGLGRELFGFEFDAGGFALAGRAVDEYVPWGPVHGGGPQRHVELVEFLFAFGEFRGEHGMILD